MSGLRDHWERVYAARPPAQVSWFQAEPQPSFDLVRRFAAERATPIIDVGGGASPLAARLAAEGFLDLTVLDIAPSALTAARAQVPPGAAVAWIAADVTTWRPGRRYGLWHDRAVFHFLTEAAAQEAYLAALHAATAPGAVVLMATFAPDGPERCSGLPVRRWGAEALAGRLGPGYAPLASLPHAHLTPGGVAQKFLFMAFRRLPA